MSFLLTKVVKGLVYESYGSPLQILTVRDIPLTHAQSPFLLGASSLLGSASRPPLTECNYVHIQFLAAPINPSDINQLEGSYPLKPGLPAVGGNEGLARVLHVGSQVTAFKPNDLVIPSLPGFGTWRTEAACLETDLFKMNIGDNVPVELAAMIQVNPCTAYRMLHDFIDLKPGNVVIQNASNSAVGQAIIQICSIKGIKTVNIIRNRPSSHDGSGSISSSSSSNDELTSHLLHIGATLVLKEEDLTGQLDSISELIKNTCGELPSLALNCVGGQSATNLAREGGIMVTYGGMSKRPLTLPTSLFIFQNIQLKGFWMSRWYSQQQAEYVQAILDKSVPPLTSALTKERNTMMTDLLHWASQGNFTIKYEKNHWMDWKKAIEKATKEFIDKKQLLTFD